MANRHQLLYRTIYYSREYEEQYEYDCVRGSTEQYTSERPTLGTCGWFVACVGSFKLMRGRRLSPTKAQAASGC